MASKKLIAAGLLLATNPIAAVNPSYFYGSYQLKDVWDDQGIPLRLPSDGPFVLKLHPDSSPESIRLSVKVGNNMNSNVQLLNDGNTGNGESSNIRVGFVMSTRMYPGSKMKQDLETYLSTYLPQMISMERNEEDLLILKSDPDSSKAKIVCQVLSDTEA